VTKVFTEDAYVTVSGLGQLNGVEGISEFVNWVWRGTKTVGVS